MNVDIIGNEKKMYCSDKKNKLENYYSKISKIIEQFSLI